MSSSVDRSTISKIILSAHRWTQPQEVQLPAVPKPLKAVGGRFPAIEQRMDDWWSQQIANGLDVRDNVARDKAKAIAREIGFPLERFKASAKWLDKVCFMKCSANQPDFGSSRTVERLLASLRRHPCTSAMATTRIQTSPTP